jgi:hypothetical protein
VEIGGRHHEKESAEIAKVQLDATCPLWASPHGFIKGCGNKSNRVIFALISAQLNSMHR